jgi:hypothetical protein
MQPKKGHDGLHGQGEIQARRANGEKDGRARGLWMRCHPRTTAGAGGCWCCCSRWRSHYLLLLSSRSSDHTLMHVARTRIQTRWQAANRREPESDPRRFISMSAPVSPLPSNGIYHPQSSSSRTATMLTRRGCRHPNLPTVLDGPRSCD